MTDLVTLISGLDVIGILVFGAFIRNFFVRLRKYEEDLQVLKKHAITKLELNEILELKLAPLNIRLHTIEDTVNKISRIIPNSPTSSI